MFFHLQPFYSLYISTFIYSIFNFCSASNFIMSYSSYNNHHYVQGSAAIVAEWLHKSVLSKIKSVYVTDRYQSQYIWAVKIYVIPFDIYPFKFSIFDKLHSGSVKIKILFLGLLRLRNMIYETTLMKPNTFNDPFWKFLDPIHLYLLK